MHEVGAIHARWKMVQRVRRRSASVGPPSGLENGSPAACMGCKLEIVDPVRLHFEVCSSKRRKAEVGFIEEWRHFIVLRGNK